MPVLTPQFLAQKTWDLYQTHGVPLEVSEDILAENNLELDSQLLNQLINNHQKLSQDASGNQFKSGVAEDNNRTRSLHTTTHLLHKVLRDIFGGEVYQRGSAITDEKARFDFSLPASELTESKLEEIEIKINDLIKQELIMIKTQMSEQEARRIGAIGLFGEKYGEIVTIYSLETKNGEIKSREFCGGPHIENTSQIGEFKILKKKSIGQGLTRLEFNVH